MTAWSFGRQLRDEEVEAPTGHFAHFAGLPLSANPHAPRSDEWRSWNVQWIRAEAGRRADEGTFDYTPEEYAEVRARDDDVRNPDPVREILGDDYLVEHSPGYLAPPEQQFEPRPFARKHVVVTLRFSQDLLLRVSQELLDDLGINPAAQPSVGQLLKHMFDQQRPAGAGPYTHTYTPSRSAPLRPPAIGVLGPDRPTVRSIRPWPLGVVLLLRLATPHH